MIDLSDRLTIWASSQSPHTQRNLFAESLAPLGFTNKDVRVIAPPIGGGFGGKAGVSMEILAAAIATKVKGSPVKIIWSREQEFYNTSQRLGVIAKLKIGVKTDGTFTAIDQLALREIITFPTIAPLRRFFKYFLTFKSSMRFSMY